MRRGVGCSAVWHAERVQGAGKSSLRRITKGSVNKLVSIRTTQDTWIAFPRTKRDDGWVTLSDADFVVAVSVDDADEPRIARAHLIAADEMRARFDRAYRARLDAGHSIPLGRGVWVSLYLQEANDPVNRVGAGAGLAHPATLKVPLDAQDGAIVDDKTEGTEEASFEGGPKESLTIVEAKRRLALTFGIDPSSVKITIEA